VKIQKTLKFANVFVNIQLVLMVLDRVAADLSLSSENVYKLTFARATLC